MNILKKKRIVQVRYLPGQRKSIGAPYVQAPTVRISVGHQWVILGLPQKPHTTAMYEVIDNQGEEKFAEEIDVILTELRKTYPRAPKKVMELLKHMTKFPSKQYEAQSTY